LIFDYCWAYGIWADGLSKLTVSRGLRASMCCVDSSVR